jgi:Amt family ammonium transporter
MIGALPAAATGIDTGDTAWMLIATALVLMMTPALGLFYAGLVRSKNTLNTFMMCIAAIAVATVTWAAVGYSLAFDGDGGLVGGLGQAFLGGVDFAPRDGTTIPELVFFAFQATFCIITVALVSGAVVERMRFGPFLVFAALWSVLVYAVLAHWAFGGGWLQAGGTLDFAGGVPVEMGSGFSALAAALVGEASVLAFTNTLLCPAATLVVWFALDLMRGRKVTAIGAATAIVVGCVAITPAGGFVSPGWAMLLGALAAVPSYAVIVWRTRTRVDETLDVLAAHGTAGLFGILFIGLFAEAAWNGVSDGLFYGNAAQFWDQVLAALAAPTYAFIVTFGLLKAIGAVMPLRAGDREEAMGMDVTQHGEEAYATGEGAILVAPEDGGPVGVPVADPG